MGGVQHQMPNSIDRGTTNGQISDMTSDGSETGRRRLGLPTLTGLVVANMIGAGAFTTSGFALNDLGSPFWVMLAWAVGGAIAFCGALCYGALSRYVAESGGEYLFLSRVVHPLIGFVAGWVSLVAGFTGAIAFAALAFEAYIQPLLPIELPGGLLAIVLVLVGALIHGVRLSIGTGIQNVAVVIKLVLIFAFLAIVVLATGLTTPSTAAVPLTPFSIVTFSSSLVWISLSYSGYNAAVYVAGEARDARERVPKAMWVGTLLVSAIYICLNATFVYLVPFDVVAGKPDVAAAAAQYVGGAPLALLVRSIIGISLLTSVFAMLMIGPRVYARMAEDNLFPKFFRFNGDVPTAAIVLQAGAAILLIVFTTLKDLLSYLGLTLSLCAALTVSCVFLLRTRMRGEFTIPGYPVVPGFFILATIVLAILSTIRSPIEIVATLVTFASGAVLYFVFSRKSSVNIP